MELCSRLVNAANCRLFQFLCALSVPLGVRTDFHLLVALAALLCPIRWYTHAVFPPCVVAEFRFPSFSELASSAHQRGFAAMKRLWSLDELVDHFTLLPNELALLANTVGATRLGLPFCSRPFNSMGAFPPPNATFHRR